MKKKFLIGKVAKLYNLSKQTLIYYDKINLLKPVNNGENRYRYYTYSDLEELDVILSLKETGMSLKEIKSFLDNRNLEKTISTLENQVEITNKKIEKLNNINRKITKKLDDLLKFKSNYKGEVKIYEKNYKERMILKIPVEYDNSDSIDMAIGEAYKKMSELLLNRNLSEYSHLSPSVGFLKENIINGIYDEVDFVFIEIKYKREYSNYINKVKNGKYICSLHFGTYEDTKYTYNKLLRYIEKNDYIINGDIIEVPKLDAWSVKKEGDYITEIQIPVKVN